MKFKTVKSRVIVLAHDDVDTDQIIPARFLTNIKRDGLAAGLFYTLRQNSNCVLNSDVGRQAEILVTGENFGCGSSREHAVWALQQWGFRVVIAKSFGDIFKANALKNGLLPVQLSAEFITALAETKRKITVDLSSQLVTLDTHVVEKFEIDQFTRQRLLEGVDELGYLMGHDKQISEWEQKYEGAMQ